MLAHDYNMIRPMRLFEVVKENLPELVSRVETFLEKSRPR